MNSKKIMKIATVLMIIATILMTANIVLGFSDLSGNPNPTNNGINSVSSVVGNVMGIVQYICYAAAVILLVSLGVRFMAASPDGKAEIKKSAVIYIVGAVLVFAAGLILNIIRSWASSAITGR